jgi:hypothetical protein
LGNFPDLSAACILFTTNLDQEARAGRQAADLGTKIALG